METKPTDLNEDQYFGSMFAVTTEGDIWMLYTAESDDEYDACVWLGNDENEWENSLQTIGADDCETSVITVYDEDDNDYEVEALLYPMEYRSVQLDLDALRNGHVIWFSTM